jgi:hypothetical protein
MLAGIASRIAQITDITGMPVSGKMSSDMTATADTPRNTMKAAST